MHKFYAVRTILEEVIVSDDGGWDTVESQDFEHICTTDEIFAGSIYDAMKWVPLIGLLKAYANIINIEDIHKEKV